MLVPRLLPILLLPAVVLGLFGPQLRVALSTRSFVIAAAATLVGALLLHVRLGPPTPFPRPRFTDPIGDTAYFVRRDRRSVFEFLSDATNDPTFWPQVVSVEKVTPGPVGLGTLFRARARTRLPFRRWIEMDATEEVVEFEPYSRFTSKIAGAVHPNHLTIVFEDADGGTRVTNHFEMVHSVASAIGGTAALKWWLDRRQQAQRSAAYARAKAILEGAPPTM